MNLLHSVSKSKAQHGLVVSCAGKEGFPSFAAAQRATSGRKRPKVKLGKLSAYRCNHCRDWHLGRTPK